MAQIVYVSKMNQLFRIQNSHTFHEFSEKVEKKNHLPFKAFF